LSRLQGKIQVRLPVFNSSEQGNAVGRNLLAKLHPLSRGPPPNRSATRQMMLLAGETAEIDGGPLDDTS